MAKELRTQDTNHTGLALSLDALRQEGAVEVTRKALFPEDRPQPTYQELSLFIAMCINRHLDPFAREAYLIKYSERSPASMVVSKDAFMERANRHEAFNGMVAGIIVQRGDKVEYTEGTFHLPSDVLLGGWARVFRKDREHPSFQSPSMAEYNSNQGVWPKIPATMIRKVAVVQALREAFPEEFGGLYDASEMQQSVRDSSVDLLAETGVTNVIPEKIQVTAPQPVHAAKAKQPVGQAQNEDGGGMCPIHNVEFDAEFAWMDNKPTDQIKDYRHADGKWPSDAKHAGAGKTKYCRQSSKEVQAAYKDIEAYQGAPDDTEPEVEIIEMNEQEQEPLI